MSRAAASTDMGNVSLVFPTIHPIIGINSLPAVNHQPEFTACCITPPADQALFDGAVAMAWTAIDAASDAKLRARLMEAQPRQN
jgi:metal-dependent amidase/aminoacylase/carboxypeptidase family protein